MTLHPRNLVALLVAGALASAAPVGAHESNNHGTIKVHDTLGVDPPQQNNPHVTCEFWIVGMNMSGDNGTIVFEQIPPTMNPPMVVLSVPWTADSGSSEDGFEFTEGPFNFTTTPGLGHYRVEVFVDEGGPPGNMDHFAKAKVFWVDPCNGPPPPPPPCPPNLAATAEADGDIHLDWDAVGGASQYLVYRAEEGDPLDFLASVPAPTTAYTDTTSVVGVTYEYQVTAVVGGVESEDCDTVRATAIPFFPGTALAVLAGLGAVGAMLVFRRR